MPVPNVVPKVLLTDPAANRFNDQLLAVLNPILRNVAGDLTGPVAAPLVRGLFGLPLAESMAAPTLGQVIAWNGLAWAPTTGGGGGGVTSVSGASPITSTGGTTPVIGISGTPVGGVAYADGSTLAYTSAGTAGAPLLSSGAGAPAFGPLDLSLAAAVTGVLPIARGGTNTNATPTNGGVAHGTGSAYAFTGAGTAGFPLLAGGTGAPSFGALNLALAGAVSGLLPIANGGTNSSAPPTAGAVPYGTGTAYAFTAAGSSGLPLVSGGAGAPSFAVLGADGGGTGLATYAAGDLLYATGPTTLARLPIGASGTVLLSTGTAPAWTVPSASNTGAGIGGYRATTTTPDTIALTDYTVDVTTTGAFTLNLPTAGSGAGQAATGRIFVVKNTGGAIITVTPAGAQLIDSAATFVVQTQFASFTFQSTGSGWVLL